MFNLKKLTKNNEGSKFRIWIQAHWWLLIIGLLLYLGGIFYPHINIDEIEWEKFLVDFSVKTGELILIGGIIGFFSSYKLIIKPYKEELKKIMFEPESLSKRKDLTMIWDNVTEKIIETKFPEIAKSLLKLIKDRYLESKDNIRCYNRYDTTFRLSWEGSDRTWVRSIESAEFCILADKEKVKLIQTNMTYASSKDDGTTVNIELIHEKNKKSKEGVYVDDKKAVDCKAEIDLNGALTYKIQKNVKKRFNIHLDDHLCFKSKYITNGMSVKVSHPQDMKITLVGVGTIDEFKKNIINPTTCEFKYDGLILPRQGYVIFITPIINL